MRSVRNVWLQGQLVTPRMMGPVDRPEQISLHIHAHQDDIFRKYPDAMWTASLRTLHLCHGLVVRVDTAIAGDGMPCLDGIVPASAPAEIYIRRTTLTMSTPSSRRSQVCILGSAEPGSRAYELAGEAGALLASLGITVVSGCGSPATTVAAERAISAGGLVLSIVPADHMPGADWPATTVVPCGMGDARNLLMALSGDACIVIGGRAGTISEVCLAWLHHRPLLPLVGHGGWSNSLPSHPPDERKSSDILPWTTTGELKEQLRKLELFGAPGGGLRLPL